MIRRTMQTFRQQVRQNAVALISLVVALSSLGYNTWRNERTEHNRNTRAAAFELLNRLAELERVVYLAQYDRDLQGGGNPRTGWTYVLAIRDLSGLVPGPVPVRAAELQTVWSENWQGLGKDDEASVTHIDDAIARLREASLTTLRMLH